MSIHQCIQQTIFARVLELSIWNETLFWVNISHCASLLHGILNKLKSIAVFSHGSERSLEFVNYNIEYYKSKKDFYLTTLVIPQIQNLSPSSPVDKQKDSKFLQITKILWHHKEWSNNQHTSKFFDFFSPAETKVFLIKHRRHHLSLLQCLQSKKKKKNLFSYHEGNNS